jgi:micrococcal nuclease
MGRPTIGLILGVLTFIALTTNPAMAADFSTGQTFTATCTHVIDGDTIVVDHDGTEVTLNLVGVDAPELEQDWGHKAQKFLRSVARKQTVDVTIVSTDGDTPLARVESRGQDLSTVLARSGMAWACEKTADADLKKLCAQAREAGAGLWSQNAPIRPADFRNAA